MSDRDVLAQLLAGVALNAVMRFDRWPDDLYDEQAAVVWADGWRKKPGRYALARLVAERRMVSGVMPDDIDVEMLGGPIADAILAFMDGLTGENDD